MRVWCDGAGEQRGDMREVRRILAREVVIVVEVLGRAEMSLRRATDWQAVLGDVLILHRRGLRYLCQKYASNRSS